MSGDDIRTLIGAAPEDAPIAELHRLAAVRRELARAEEVQVRRARNLGYSWQAIAARPRREPAGRPQEVRS